MELTPLRSDRAGKDGGDFYLRMDFARRIMFLTIEKGWTPGLGPNDKPYWMCSEEELEFDGPACDALF